MFRFCLVLSITGGIPRAWTVHDYRRQTENTLYRARRKWMSSLHLVIEKIIDEDHESLDCSSSTMQILTTSNILQEHLTVKSVEILFVNNQFWEDSILNDCTVMLLYTLMPGSILLVSLAMSRRIVINMSSRPNIRN